MNYLIQFLICFILFSWLGCLDGPEIRLSKDDLNLVDSLYGELSDSMRILADSICTQYHDEIFQKMVDSIVNERMIDMIKIQER